MERYEQITRAVYEAMDEVNDMVEPDRALEKAPDTVLIGEAARLDSQGFVNLAVALEENVERMFNKPINVIDLLSPDEPETLTVATLVTRIANLLG